MTPVRTRVAGALLALALVPVSGVALAPAAGAEPVSNSLGHSITANALNPVGSRAAQLRSTLAAAFQAHDALGAITQSAYLRFGPTQGRAAERVLAASRQELAKGVGGLGAPAAAFRDALAAHDAAKLAYAQGVDRYHGSSARAAAAARAASVSRRSVTSSCVSTTCSTAPPASRTGYRCACVQSTPPRPTALAIS